MDGKVLTVKYDLCIICFVFLSCVQLIGAEWTSLYKINYNHSLYSKTYAKYLGDIYLGGLFSMNRFDDTKKCTEIIEQDGLQVLSAAIYGIQLVNNMSMLPVKLGLLAVDTCQNVNYVVEQSIEFMQFKMINIQKSYTCQGGDVPKLKEELESFRNIFGVFGAGNSDVSMAVSNYLKLIKLPQLSYFSTSPILTSPVDDRAFFRSIPSDRYMTQAIINLLKRYKWLYVIILKDSSEYSTEITDRFKNEIKIKENADICLGDTIKIPNQSPEGLSETVKQILEAHKKKTPRVILTFLNQPVAQAFVNYIGENPNEKLSKLMWIATDSWGGRNWPKMNVTNSILNNTIAVIPKAFDNSDFMERYRDRLPSQIDCDPWLARTFELKCGCQYRNRTLFIILELEKIRATDLNMTSCEDIEVDCRNLISKDLKQMLYIHYVIDGILAYGYTLKELIPKNCSQISEEDCVKSLFATDTLNIGNIVRVMKNINFTDSTGETFRFWDNSGAPKYSIVYFNKTVSDWSISGSILENKTLSIDNSFDAFLNENFQFILCDKLCTNRQARSVKVNCCWNCTDCLENEFVVNLDVLSSTQRCSQCNDSQILNSFQNSCLNAPEVFISFNNQVAVSLIVINVIGLLCSLVSCFVMIFYWRTPIIKALGRETSIIILIGTMLSFALSIALLDKPNNLICNLRWSSPAFCSTLVYAAILTKTNRIARIFNIKPSSKKNSIPRFISPISQINIVLLITLVESVILIALNIFSGIEATYPGKTKSRVWDCSEIGFSNLISIWLIPTFLLIFSTLYAFKIRKTPDGFNETRNLNFLNFANCIIYVTCLLLQQVLTKDQYSVLPFVLMLTVGGHENLIILFYPKIYVILFRPSKNTIQFITAKSRSFSHSLSISSNLEAPTSKLSTAGGMKCERCNFMMIPNLELDNLSRQYADSDRVRGKSKSKVQFSNNSNDEVSNDSGPHNDSSTKHIDLGFDNKSYVAD